MHRLRVYLAVLSGACIAGAALIAAFALGYYDWIAIALSGALGVVLAWPSGIWLARRIKRDDPAWDQRRDRPKEV
ncbi:MAG: hypothetical protein KDK02_16310 [Rhodobacteraceae bacterium]|nr:hypothetical protein [Paracoccaceae bacterium]